MAIQFPSGGGVDAVGGRGGESLRLSPIAAGLLHAAGVRKDGVFVVARRLQADLSIQIPASYFGCGRRFYLHCIK
ncbi:hypothetical protein, partial [Nitrosomonas europaea]|uniref:hypothetical protein n=1 Tax=Nitrosomonas europaea TaxID=915 RepID=UPI0023F16B8D